MASWGSKQIQQWGESQEKLGYYGYHLVAVTTGPAAWRGWHLGKNWGCHPVAGASGLLGQDFAAGNYPGLKGDFPRFGNCFAAAGVNSEKNILNINIT